MFVVVGEELCFDYGSNFWKTRRIEVLDAWIVSGLVDLSESVESDLSTLIEHFTAGTFVHSLLQCRGW